MVETVKPTTLRGVRAPSAPVYTLGTNPAERERLQRQSHDLVDHSLALLSRVDLPAGGRALDLGCGPAGTIELLAERVGPTGSVTAIDIDPAHVAMARRLVQDRGLANVEVLQADARHTGLPSGSFDVVHARLVLVNIPSPEQVVAEMVRLVKPGGWVLTDEADAMAGICYPPEPAWDRLRGDPPRRLPRRRGRPLHRPQADPPARRRRAGRHRGRRARRRVPRGPRPPHPPSRPCPQLVGQGRRGRDRLGGRARSARPPSPSAPG